MNNDLNISHLSGWIQLELTSALAPAGRQSLSNAAESIQATASGVRRPDTLDDVASRPRLLVAAQTFLANE